MQPSGAKTELFIFLLHKAEGLTSIWKYFKNSHCKEFKNNSVERRHCVFKIKMFLKKKWYHSHPAPSLIQETEVPEHSYSEQKVSLLHIALSPAAVSRWLPTHPTGVGALISGD